MYRLLSVLAILAANFAAAKVFVLDDSNFEKTLSEHSPMLIEFYAPWCGHCKALEPEYEQAGNILESKKAAVYLGKVDATSEAAAQLAKRFEIQGFPTLKFFAKSAANSDVVDYDGERKATNIVSWLEKKTGPAFTTLTNEADLNKAKASVTAENEKIAVVGVFTEKEQIVAFEQVAKKDFSREFYAVIGNSALASKVASSGAPFIQVLRSFNISNPALTNNAEIIGDAAKLEKFILESSEPFSNVVTFTDNDLIGTVAEGVHVVEFYAPWCGYCKQFAPEYDKVAVYFKDKEPKVVIAKYDATTNDEVTEREGIESFPTVKIYKNGLAATYNGEMQKDNVIKYIEEKLNAAATTIKDESAVASFVTDVPSAVVGCVTAKNDHIVDTIAFQAASAMFKVGKLRCEEGKEFLSVYLSGKKKSTYPADQSISDLQAVTKWYKRASVNPVFKFDDVIFDEILAADYKHVVFFLNNNIEGNEPELKLFEELAAAETFKDTAYAYASAAEDYLLQYFQVKSDDLPVIRLLDTSGGMTSYVGPNDVSKESLATMFQQLEEGSLERVTESEDEDDGDDDEEYAEEGEDDEDNEEDEADEEEAQDEL